MNTLSNEATKLISAYLSLPLGNGCSCPYFNNKRSKIRGGLSALVGKGAPDEIAFEAKIIAQRKKIKIDVLNSQELKKFLTDNGLGIDCSGFAYNILDAESRARGRGKLSSHIKLNTNFVRKILYKLRPEKNTSVEIIANPKNSFEIPLENAAAGDIITILKTGPKKNYNHTLVINEVFVDAIGTKILHYIHSYAWPADGKYGHGVRTGEIRIASPNLSLTQAKWTENNLIDKNNYTFLSALEADETSLRRLKIFETKN